MMKENARIVLIEDDETLVQTLAEVLRGAGYVVDVGKDGREGLDRVEEREPDLILLDIIMPKVDGFEVLQKLKHRGITERVPVIVFTNLGQEEDRNECMKLGARDYIVKASMDIDEVLNMVKRELEKQEMPQPEALGV